MTDDETEYEISDEPPRDEDGHPIHPERGHRICGATKSDRTTPTEHGRERDEYDYCLLAAGWGEDRKVGPCQRHPITGEQWGESNPNYEHGLNSELLSDKDKEKLDELEDYDDLEKLEHLVDYEMVRFLRAEGLLEDPSLDPQYICRHCGWELPSPQIAQCPNCEVPVDDPIETYKELHMNDGPHANRAETIARLVDTKSKVKHRRDKIEKGEKIRSEHSGTIDSERTLGDEEKEIARSYLKERHERAAAESRDE